MDNDGFNQNVFSTLVERMLLETDGQPDSAIETEKIIQKLVGKYLIAIFLNFWVEDSQH